MHERCVLVMPAFRRAIITQFVDPSQADAFWHALAPGLALHDERVLLAVSEPTPLRVCLEAREHRIALAARRKASRLARERELYIKLAIRASARAGAYTLGKRVYVEHCVRCVMEVESPPAEVVDAMMAMQAVWASRQKVRS